jgi:hypothetical protein
MDKKNYLDSLQSKTLFFIWINSPILITYKDLANRLYLTDYLNKTILKELNEKKWISKKSVGKKVLLIICKRNLPQYIIKRFEQLIDTEDSAICQ